MDSKVDDFISGAKQWQEETIVLRQILLECGLTEAFKWRQPCYTYKNNNVIIIGGFKDHCVLAFFKGVLLSDTEGILQKPGENSQSSRVLRFTSAKEILQMEATIKAYVFEAIEIENAGLKVEFTESKDLDYPEELETIFDESPAFQEAFESLSPGRQRAYNMFFAAAKQSKTRVDRIEKYRQRIMDGIGMNDCTCGLSNRMPNCDGSHKQLLQ